MAVDRTSKLFSDALKEVLLQQGSGVRDLGRRLDVDPTFLSRMTVGERLVPDGFPERVALELGLPSDFFPETRVARISDALLAEPGLLDRIYDELAALGRIAGRPANRRT